MSVSLLALAFVYGAATAIVARELWDGLRSRSRTGNVDLTAKAARGELLHLDWGDQRREPPTPPMPPPSSFERRNG